MELINDLEQIKSEIDNNEFAMLYIQAPDCGLCSVMLEKIEALTDFYRQLRTMRAEIHVVPQIASAFMVATAPTLLLFCKGREVYRAGTFIDTLEVENQLNKWSRWLSCLT